MNAFFASVEMRHNPRLRGKPVIVCGPSTRGVVSAASYEARVYGVRSAMARYKAEKLCPHGVFIPGNFRRYAEASSEISSIFSAFSSSVEKVSTDEAFLDITGASPHWDSPHQLASKLQEKIWNSSSLPCSIGIASSKVVAKVASELAKPKVAGRKILAGKKIIEVRSGNEAAFLSPLPIQALWGIGPKTTQQLHGLGITHVADLQRVSLAILSNRFGRRRGQHLANVSRGIDASEVQKSRRASSLSQERTFAKDLYTFEEMHPVIIALSDAVASRLRKTGMKAFCFSLKMKHTDFSVIQRSKTVLEATNCQYHIKSVVAQLLADLSYKDGVRLLGVAASSLCDAAYSQLALDVEGHGKKKWEQVDTAVDTIRSKFGSESIAY